MLLLPIRFDYAKVVNSQYMNRNFWLQTIENMLEFFEIISTAKVDKV